MTLEAAHIAWCPDHGLHGERTACFVCGGPVAQLPMIPAECALTGNEARLLLALLSASSQPEDETLRALTESR